MVDGRNGFIRFELAISQKMHLANMAKKVYPVLDPDLDPVLRIQHEGIPTFSDLKKILERVGRPYDWDLRKEYHEAASVAYISEKLAQPGSRRYSFWVGNKEVGGTIIANVEPDVRRIFEKAADDNGIAPLGIEPDDASKTIEIYKIGLFPEHTKRGWGKHFLPMLFKELFNHPSEPEVVYLNTRNTNHEGVLKFYTGLNMNVIHARSYPNDLIPRSRLRKPANDSGFEAVAPMPAPNPNAGVA